MPTYYYKQCSSTITYISFIIYKLFSNPHCQLQYYNKYHYYNYINFTIYSLLPSTTDNVSIKTNPIL